MLNFSVGVSFCDTCSYLFSVLRENYINYRLRGEVVGGWHSYQWSQLR